MSIALLNQSTCPLCGNTIKDDQHIYMFPPFVQNTKDTLYQFSDSSVHLDCLTQNSLGERAIQFSENYILSTRPENRICVVDKKIIDNYEDYFFTNLLTSDQNDELYNYNFLTINKKNIKKWHNKDRFIYLVSQFVKEDKWLDLTSFKYLENLVNTVQN
jgi:hypothetical protein